MPNRLLHQSRDRHCVSHSIPLDATGIVLFRVYVGAAIAAARRRDIRLHVAALVASAFIPLEAALERVFEAAKKIDHQRGGKRRLTHRLECSVNTTPAGRRRVSRGGVSFIAATALFVAVFSYLAATVDYPDVLGSLLLVPTHSASGSGASDGAATRPSGCVARRAQRYGTDDRPSAVSTTDGDHVRKARGLVPS
jgi:hypothetical protein